MVRSERGAVLIEVIIALTILAAIGAALLSSAWLWHRTAERAREAEADLRAASAFMEAVTLWTRAELDQRLGDRAQGTWRLRIERPLQSLYVVSLADIGHRELIRTAVFRELPNNE